MSDICKGMKSIVGAWLPVFVALVIGYAAADSSSRPATARADVRQTPQRAAFKSGAARSETLLREIASTLKRIDARLERIEKMAARGGQPAR